MTSNEHGIDHLVHDLYSKFMGSFKPGARAAATGKPANDFKSNFKYDAGMIKDIEDHEKNLEYVNAVAGVAFLGLNGSVDLTKVDKAQLEKYAGIGKSNLYDHMEQQDKVALRQHIQEGEVEQIVAKYTAIIRELNDPKVTAAQNIQRSKGPVLKGVLDLLSKITDGGNFGDTMKKWYGNLQGYMNEL